MIDVDGAVVVVTGGARGIGRATAARLVAAGAKVWIGDIDVPAVKQAASDLGIRGYRLDVSDADSFGSFLAQAEKDGPVKMLVNNAGILRSGPFLEQSLEGHAREIGVNLLGVVNGMHHALPPMVERGEGHVVNLASMAAKLTTPQLATYCATKFAVAALSRAVRAELTGTGVTISTVMPAAVRTDLVSHFDLGPAIPVLEPDEVARAIVASARHGRPEILLPRWLHGVGFVEQVVPAGLLDRAKRAAVDRVTT